MAKNLIDPIAQGIKEFDNNSHPIDNYKFLAWEGLEEYGKQLEYISPEELEDLGLLLKQVINDSYTSPCEKK